MRQLELPTQAYLQECFSYNQETGELVWKIRPIHHFKNSHGMNYFNARFSGKIAGSKTIKGYLRVDINQIGFTVHRVIWKLVTGNDPLEQIDHKNHNKSDNSWNNLRHCTQIENQQNTRKRKTNTSGYKGVSWRKSHKKFVARITYNGKRIHIGLFDTAVEAWEAYKEKAEMLHKEFAYVE